MAVGSPTDFLPILIRRIDSSSSESTRLLLLHALKEVILHSSAAQIDGLAEALWRPLFANDVVALATNGSAANATGEPNDIGDDGVRNVKAACIGKLTTAAPAKFLPELQVCYVLGYLRKLPTELFVDERMSADVVGHNGPYRNYSTRLRRIGLLWPLPFDTRLSIPRHPMTS